MKGWLIHLAFCPSIYRRAVLSVHSLQVDVYMSVATILEDQFWWHFPIISQLWNQSNIFTPVDNHGRLVNSIKKKIKFRNEIWQILDSCFISAAIFPAAVESGVPSWLRLILQFRYFQGLIHIIVMKRLSQFFYCINLYTLLYPFWVCF